jgi:predicted NAD/FAD-dependent oxidoreductase
MENMPLSHTVRVADPVLVVGAGISGLACAQMLQSAGVPVRVVERGRVPGGRMASRRLNGRPVDLGAAFFTADLATPFGAVVRGWLEAGIARPWTDTFSVSDDGGALIEKSGPIRYAAPAGLRALATRLAEGLEVEFEHSVDTASTAAPITVLAMPDPQARRLLPSDSAVAASLDDGAGWAPTIAVALGWDEAVWPRSIHGVFVNGSPTLTFVADDGDRRGDGAPVLVAHSTPGLAARYLSDPDAAIAPITEAVRALLDINLAPSWSYAHRWTFARTLAGHPEPYLLRDGIGVCGDGWGATSSVGTAWASGDALGRAIADQLG